jgi:hypothetical protein
MSALWIGAKTRVCRLLKMKLLREGVIAELFEYYLLAREGRLGRMPGGVEIRRARKEDSIDDEFG